MSALTHACFLNNQGVALLCKGDNAQANIMLQKALAVMKQSAANGEPTAAAPVVPSSPSSMLMSDDSIYPLRVCQITIPSMERDIGYIYNRPFLLDFECVSPQDMEAVLPLYSSVLLFNLALVYHEQGYSGKETSLKKASNLYKMGLQLLENFPYRTAATAVLAVAALNNKAQVQCELCDYAHSKQCLTALSKLLGEVKPLIYNELNSTVLEGFVLNSLMLNRPTAAQAA